MNATETKPQRCICCECDIEGEVAVAWSFGVVCEACDQFEKRTRPRVDLEERIMRDVSTSPTLCNASDCLVCTGKDWSE